MKHPIKPETFEGMADGLRQGAQGLDLIRQGCEGFAEVDGLNRILKRARLATLLAAQYTEAAAALIEAHNEKQSRE